MAVFIVEKAAEHGLWAVVSFFLGAAGSRWWFGNRNSRLLADLQNQVNQLQSQQHQGGQTGLSSTPVQQPAAKSNVKKGLDRQWSSLGPLDLLELMKEKTQYAAEEYEGQWFRVEGKIEGAAKRDENKMIIEVTVSNNLIAKLVFNSKSLQDQASNVREGYQIAAAGRLDSVSYAGGTFRTIIWFRKCELLEPIRR